MDFIKRKGGTVLLHDGHQFYKLRSYKKEGSIWRCSNYKKEKCTGTVKIKDDVIKKQKMHKCRPNEEKNIVDKTFANLKLTVTNSDRPIPHLYNEAIVNLEDAGLNFVEEISSLSNSQHCLYSIRNKYIGVSKTVFKYLEEVEVPGFFLSYVLADYAYEGSRILIFCSLKNKELVSNVKEYFLDGTFKSCPKPFAQLYTLLGDVGSSVETTKVLPLIYALLPDKTEKTYKTLFSLIKSQLPHWTPEIIHCDYEIAAINSIRGLFPEIQIKGCFYHWSRAIWRKAKSLSGNLNKAQKRIVGLTAALPLLPPTHVTEGWNDIKCESATTEMSTFVKYIDKYWLNKNNVQNILSVFGQRPRTNNAIEGWHSKLNKCVNKNTVTLLRLLNTLNKFDLEATCTLKFNIKRPKRSQIFMKKVMTSLCKFRWSL